MRKFLYQSLGIILGLALLSSCAKNSGPENNGPPAGERLQHASALNTQLALNYIEQGDMVTAKEKLLLALKQEPNSVAANSTMAYYLERSGDLKNAEGYYRKAISIAEVKGGPQNNYGTFLCRQKRYQDADNYFQSAIKDQQYVNTAKAYENAGLCALLVPDQAKAKEYFRKALQNDPNLTSAMLQMAKLEYDTGEYAEGYEHITNYLLLVKSPSAAALWLGVRLAKLKKDQAAVDNYGMQLQQKFSGSPEYQQYLQSRTAAH